MTRQKQFANSILGETAIRPLLGADQEFELAIRSARPTPSPLATSDS